MDSIKVSCWIAFLKFKGCTYKSTEASHEKWRCPNCTRSIIFWGSKKEIPINHIFSNLRSMGVLKRDFTDWIAKNC
ncbi:hypothetical protein HMF3257_31700 [Spirosoma telluris]|uniref:Transposase n=1 Tax=Spirosoma telluris TaxID=2183553 RepID=A0A327NSM3_9BACT|nr:hypothetical protein HMF3257_31700 [Spirosoma telluris]